MGSATAAGAPCSRPAGPSSSRSPRAWADGGGLRPLSINWRCRCTLAAGRLRGLWLVGVRTRLFQPLGRPPWRMTSVRSAPGLPERPSLSAGAQTKPRVSRSRVGARPRVITSGDSVTDAARRGNDLLMMVSDEELLVASVGDEEAFAAFYRRYARPLAGFFMRRTGDAELAADLTAETFAAALASRRRFDPAKGPAIGWLYGIARHKLARTQEHGRVEDRARRTLGMAPLALDDEAIELLVTADGDVVQLMQRLPADQRAAIEARVLDEQEYEQIAAATQTSEAVIRKRRSARPRESAAQAGGPDAMTDFFDDLEYELRRAHRRDTERHARSRVFDLRRLPGLPRDRPANAGGARRGRRGGLARRGRPDRRAELGRRTLGGRRSRA